MIFQLSTQIALYVSSRSAFEMQAPSLMKCLQIREIFRCVFLGEIFKLLRETNGYQDQPLMHLTVSLLCLLMQPTKFEVLS